MRCRGKGPQDQIRGERGAKRGREIGVQEAGRLCGGGVGHECGSRAGRGEQLDGRVRLGVAQARRRARAVRKALPASTGQGSRPVWCGAGCAGHDTDTLPAGLASAPGDD